MTFLLHFCCIVKPLFWWQLLKITVTIEFLLFVFLLDTPFIMLCFPWFILFFLMYSWNFILINRDQRLWKLKEFLKSIVPKHLTLWMRKRALERLWSLPAFFSLSHCDPTTLVTGTCQASSLLIALSLRNAELTEAVTGHSTKEPLSPLLFH